MSLNMFRDADKFKFMASLLEFEFDIQGVEMSLNLSVEAERVLGVSMFGSMLGPTWRHAQADNFLSSKTRGEPNLVQVRSSAGAKVRISGVKSTPPERDSDLRLSHREKNHLIENPSNRMETHSGTSKPNQVCYGIGGFDNIIFLFPIFARLRTLA